MAETYSKVQLGRDARNATPRRSWKTTLAPWQTGRVAGTPKKGSGVRHAPLGMNFVGRRWSMAATLAACLEGGKMSAFQG